MQRLAIQTDDFSAYHDLVAHLRERNVPFLSLAPGQDAPSFVSVLITTAREAPHARHPRVIVYTSPAETLEAASWALSGAAVFRRCVVGIDPGERPGVAVLADGRVLRLVHAASPEAVRRAAAAVLETVPARAFLFRIGDGAPTLRDRILRGLWDFDVPVELVDETRSTPAAHGGGAYRDTAAATTIALSPGQPLMPAMSAAPRPTPGELRDIQRKSRIRSLGRVTISRTLARDVAVGHLTLDEAVRQQSDGLSA